MHGGDIYNNKIEYDFSVNVNPFGPYEEVKEAVVDAVSNLNVYPEYSSETLKKSISEYHNIPSEWVCVTNGASEALSAIIGNQYIHDVIIETPSFLGYEASLNPEQQLHTYTRNTFLKLNENMIPRNSILVLGNPSNPTGDYTDAFIVNSLYKRVRDARGILLVDESFLSLSDYAEKSLIKYIEKDPEYYDSLVVVRSFTKSFSIPSIRLGYFVCSDNFFVNVIQNSLPEWNISKIAQVAGIECIKSASRVADDYKKIKALKKRMEGKLKELGFLVYESATNYILFAGKNDLYEKLLEKKILIRDCSDYRGIDEVIDKMLCSDLSMNSNNLSVSGTGIYRIAVKTKEENDILIKAIEEILLTE